MENWARNTPNPIKSGHLSWIRLEWLVIQMLPSSMMVKKIFYNKYIIFQIKKII